MHRGNEGFWRKCLRPHIKALLLLLFVEGCFWWFYHTRKDFWKWLCRRIYNVTIPNLYHNIMMMHFCIKFVCTVNVLYLASVKWMFSISKLHHVKNNFLAFMSASLCPFQRFPSYIFLNWQLHPYSDKNLHQTASSSKSDVCSSWEHFQVIWPPWITCTTEVFSNRPMDDMLVATLTVQNSHSIFRMSFESLASHFRLDWTVGERHFFGISHLIAGGFFHFFSQYWGGGGKNHKGAWDLLGLFQSPDSSESCLSFSPQNHPPKRSLRVKRSWNKLGVQCPGMFSWLNVVNSYFCLISCR